MNQKMRKLINSLRIEIRIFNIFFINNLFSRRKFKLYRHITKSIFNSMKMDIPYSKPKFRMNRATMEFLNQCMEIDILYPKTPNDVIIKCDYCNKFYFGDEHNTIHYKCYLKYMDDNKLEPKSRCPECLSSNIESGHNGLWYWANCNDCGWCI